MRERLLDRFGFFGDHSSLHGMRYFLSSHPIPIAQRLIWLLFVSLSITGMLYILYEGTALFEDDAISFVKETTYLHWDTDFPAITVCENVDNDKLRDYYEENNIPIKLTTFYKEIIFSDSQHNCRSCSSCKNDDCPENLQEIARNYRSPCNETLARCSWRDQAFECCERFKPIDTEFGECFVFNSAFFGGTRKHISNKLTGPGYLKFATMETVTIDIHSPDDVTFDNFDKQVINGNEGYLPFGTEFTLRLKVEETSNEDEVHRLPAKVRRCLFAHEINSDQASMYPLYSYSTCIVHCRARKQLLTCNCTHHLLPRMSSEKPCDIDGLLCLRKLAETLSEEDIDLECECLPSCEEPNYRPVIIKNIPNTGELTDELIDRGTVISIYMEFLPSTRIRRLVVRSSLDYVVFVGGTAGIFFGASVLSLLEIIYLIFIRKYSSE